MRGDTPFAVTEWEWLKLQLRLYAVERSPETWIERFSFDDERRTIACSIWCKTTQRLIEEKADRARQFSFYSNWVEVETIQVSTLLQQLPVLSTEYDLRRDLAFEILYDYGMGSSLVCEFSAGEVTWHRDS